jgi:hypothetical protein
MFTPSAVRHHRALGTPRRPTRLLGTGLTVLAIVAGSAVSISTAAAAAPASKSNPSAAQVNKSLQSMAKLFAHAVTDSSLRQQIHDGVAQRFDGDTDILYSALATTSDVRQALTSAYRQARSGQPSDALSAVDRLASSIPRLQVAVPVGFDSWDPAAYTPLVAYMPVGVDDTKLKTITAFDATGRAHTLDAQVEPAQPVIVLGLSERTDDSGTLLQQGTLSTVQTTTVTATAYAVRMVKVHLIHDNEPWPKGDAEISLRAQGCGISYYDRNWSSLNDDDDWWYGPRWLGQTRCHVYFYWWEDDGSNWDFTLSYKGVSLNIKMDDSDDLIGGVELLHSKFEGGSNNKVAWSDLVQWTD